MTGPSSIAAAALAAVDAVGSYRRGMYGPAGGTSYVKPAVIAGSVLLLLWVAVYAYDRWSRRRQRAAKEDRSLFGDLCSAHGLTAAERQYLEALAKQASVEPTAAIFIRPEVVRPLLESGSQGELWSAIGRKIYGDAA